MPGMIDKVLINFNSVEGMNAAIEAEFETLTKLGEEIQKLDLLSSANPIRDKLKAACKTYDAAQLAFLNAQRECIEEAADLIDKKVCP